MDTTITERLAARDAWLGKAQAYCVARIKDKAGLSPIGKIEVLWALPVRLSTGNPIADQMGFWNGKTPLVQIPDRVAMGSTPFIGSPSNSALDIRTSLITPEVLLRPRDALAVVLHETIHTCFDDTESHGPRFTKAHHSVGLVGNPLASQPGNSVDYKTWESGVFNDLGPIFPAFDPAIDVPAYVERLNVIRAESNARAVAWFGGWERYIIEKNNKGWPAAATFSYRSLAYDGAADAARDFARVGLQLAPIGADPEYAQAYNRGMERAARAWAEGIARSGRVSKWRSQGDRMHRHGRADDSNPSYRSGMRDAGRGHLLDW